MLVEKDIKVVYLWDKQVRPEIEPNYLCFTSEEANVTIRLHKRGSPTSVEIETSTDWTTWSDYTFDAYITLANIWDKVYFRNKSTTDTWFSTSSSNYYQFIMSWAIGASWDITTLLNKKGTKTLHGNYCFYSLFSNSNLTTAPSLPATTLTEWCYGYMFNTCTSLSTIPALPATTLTTGCYYNMFYKCYPIHLSTTQTWDYQTPYRIPTTWTWTAGSISLNDMFSSTWWTFTWTPSVNTTYYTSNTVVS